MTRDEITKMEVNKVARELSPEGLEFLFRPSNGLELLARIDLEGTKDKVQEARALGVPGPISAAERVIEMEELYRRVKEAMACLANPHRRFLDI